MKAKKNDEIIRYKIYDYTNPNLQVSFHINTTPYSERHYHDYWEVMIMLEGSCVNVINGRDETLEECEIQILRPNDLHYCKKKEKDEHQLLNIEIKTDFFENFCNIFQPTFLESLNGYEKNIPKFKCDAVTYEKILYLMRLAQRYYEVDAPERQFFSKKLLAFVLFAFEERFSLEEIEKATDKSFSYNLITMLNQPENIGLKLNEVCKKYPCSVEYAIRRFRAEGMDTPNKIFRKIKLDYACLLLKTTDKKIIRISEEVGFFNIGYFNGLFQEVYGLTPKDYRKRYKNAKGPTEKPKSQ